MTASVPCPVCDRAAMHPRWPSVRTTPWTDDCACSDYSHCLMHRYGDEQPPKRPPAPELALRAQAAFERACEDHAHLLTRFAKYEALKAEVEQLRAQAQELWEAHGDRERVAEAQRDADIKAFAAWLREVQATGDHSPRSFSLADAVDIGEFTVPLVTEVDKS